MKATMQITNTGVWYQKVGYYFDKSDHVVLSLWKTFSEGMCKSLEFCVRKILEYYKQKLASRYLAAWKMQWKL